MKKSDKWIGHLVALKVQCLGNPVGAIGVCFNDYGDGRQYIFENGNYDGFSIRPYAPPIGWPNPTNDKRSEVEAFLIDLGYHDEEYFTYTFTNVTKLSEDFNKGVFDKAFEEGRFLRDNPPE